MNYERARAAKGVLMAGILAVALMAGCTMPKKVSDAIVNQQKGVFREGFGTMVAHVELYKKQTGSYPETLEEIKYMGDYGNAIAAMVEYHKEGEGYVLNLQEILMKAEEMGYYPDEFFNNLGLVSSNMKKPAASEETEQ